MTRARAERGAKRRLFASCFGCVSASVKGEQAMPSNMPDAINEGAMETELHSARETTRDVQKPLGEEIVAAAVDMAHAEAVTAKDLMEKGSRKTKTASVESAFEGMYGTEKSASPGSSVAENEDDNGAVPPPEREENKAGPVPGATPKHRRNRSDLTDEASAALLVEREVAAEEAKRHRRRGEMLTCHPVLMSTLSWVSSVAVDDDNDLGETASDCE